MKRNDITDIIEFAGEKTIGFHIDYHRYPSPEERDKAIKNLRRDGRMNGEELDKPAGSIRTEQQGIRK